ncbi:MAG: hypothetical protein H6R10_1669 [Rhodocyclaceae bacterium]|nr:hypothetical protein [Rhodocyclaceae bacterium]
MTPEQQEKLGCDYRKYQEEAAKMAAEGKAIGTFIGWQYENKLVKIKIATTWEEHRRTGIIFGD